MKTGRKLKMRKIDLVILNYMRNIKEKYKSYRKKLRILVKCAKSQFQSEKFDKYKGNSKKTWELINELRGKSVSKTNHSNFVVQGKLVKERRIIADEFNKYFTSLAHNLNENASKQWDNDDIHLNPIPHFSTFIGKRVDDSMFFEPCCNEEIESTIRNLDNNKASDISARVLKSCNSILTPYLTAFYNHFIIEKNRRSELNSLFDNFNQIINI